ncbi:MAG TPA: glycerophosphodiester phosphodiesterase [Acidimicrobiales bacterium]
MTAPAVHAHRGSPDPATGVGENTLDAFLRARRLGADGVELDVRRTADGALAVHHDPEIRGVGAVHQLRSDQLPASVPLLAAALRACEGLEVNIELKNLPTEPGFDPEERMARDVAQLVVAAGRARTVVVSSFWPGSLDAVVRDHPELSTGLLVPSWLDPADGVAEALRHGCRALHPHASTVGGTLVAEARRAGLSLAVWTVNDRAQVEAMADLGVDTVITDDVPLALSALGRA